LATSPRPGALRRGTRFEIACQDLFEALDYTTVFENEEFPCKHPQEHRKRLHEIDLLLKFEGKFFLKPWCSTKRPLIECHSNIKKPSTRKDRTQLVKDVLERIECVKDYGYDVTCGIVTTNSTLPGLFKILHRGKKFFVWDQTRMTFYAYKIFKFRGMESSLFQIKERKINDETSFLWAAQKHEKQEQYLHNVGIFFDKTIRKKRVSQVNATDLRAGINHIKNEILKKNLSFAKLYVDLFSISGFTRTIYDKKDDFGKRLSTNEISVAIEKVLDVETTPWWALIK